MNKIIDLTGINKYFCSLCNIFHVRKYKQKIIMDENFKEQIIKTKDTPFFNHQEFAHKLTSSELWKLQFRRSLQNYSIESHKESYKSKKQ